MLFGNSFSLIIIKHSCSATILGPSIK